MPESLVLMRHAKSSWRDESLGDRERPLNGRGRSTAPRVARALVERGWQPDRVASSPATRALQTWQYMESELSDPPSVEVHPALYPGGLDAVQEVLHELAGSGGTLLIIAHNPGMEYVLYALTGESMEMKTADAALLVREGDGAARGSVLPGGWRLDSFLRARELS